MLRCWRKKVVLMEIDLNGDLGESFGIYEIGKDRELLNIVTSANIACGYHAGDHATMYETVRLAKQHRVAVGAHPGIDDLRGFGRRIVALEARDVYQMMLYQLGALKAFTDVHGITLNHVKPHGALYNMAARNCELATAIAEAVYDFSPQLILYGLAQSELTTAGERLGLTVAHEVFADRMYEKDGTLTPRNKKNALITDPLEAIERVLQMIHDGETEASDGTIIQLRADTVCVHGDSPQSYSFAEQLSEGLKAHGIEVKPLRNVS